MARTAIGFIWTALWIAVATVHVRESWAPLSGFSADELSGLLAAQSAEIAFFWVVIGYIWLAVGHFEQSAQSRRTLRLVETTLQESAAARLQFEAESRRLREYEAERIRAAQPLWEIQGCIAHKQQHEINLRNTGAAASSIRATWRRELPLIVAISNSVLVDRGEQLTLKVMFQDAPLDEFDVTLEYCDGIREIRRASIAVSEAAVAITHEEH